ncbi:hypothetical protein M9Y10_005860 [Tritrichomonas musculus]|uniref:Cyclin-like domain-containing protein n=1 Tax=Tritrichomonas musculus TaxID=1915356 RepID=A0ABR2JD73_9EUKA
MNEKFGKGNGKDDDANRYVESPSSSSSSSESDSNYMSDMNQMYFVHCPPPTITVYGNYAINRFRKEEKKRMLDPNYRINVQKEIEEGDRNNLVLWMLSVSSELEASDAAIFLAVKIFDYLLSKVEISRDNLKIYAPCALLIAIKSEDIEHMQILERLCPLSVNVEDQELRDLEISVFKIIDYNVIFSTVYIFMTYYIDKCETLQRDKFYNIVRFFAFSAVSTYNCSFYFDSETIAISCVLLGALVLKEKHSFSDILPNFPNLKECTEIILNASRDVLFYKYSNELKPYFVAISKELNDFLAENHIKEENGDFVNNVFNGL